MLAEGLEVPVCAKIRLLPEVPATVAFAQMLERAGCAMVCVHGRQREQTQHRGHCDWSAIAAVRAALHIPVLAGARSRFLGPSEDPRTIYRRGR